MRERARRRPEPQQSQRRDENHEMMIQLLIYLNNLYANVVNSVNYETEKEVL